jgi:hypothetical protein
MTNGYKLFGARMHPTTRPLSRYIEGGSYPPPPLYARAMSVPIWLLIVPTPRKRDRRPPCGTYFVQQAAYGSVYILSAKFAFDIVEWRPPH